MESRGIIRNILIALVGLGVLVLVIVLIVRLFSGGSEGPTSTLNVTDYSNQGASVTLLVDSVTKLDQDHRQVRITVSESQNMIEVFHGYQSTVQDVRTYSNNPSAFGTFLQTIHLLGFESGTDEKVDYRGYCPTGQRYVFTFNDGNVDRFERWTTSCSKITGTFTGQKAAILQQIRLQIPQTDYAKLTSGIAMGF